MSECVLITGATGLVGAELVRHLAARGMRTGALSRSAASARKKVSPLSEAWDWEPGGVVPADALRGRKAVVHLAGESVAGRWTAEKKRKIEESRVAGTRGLVDAMGALPESERPGVLVSASAMGYYGDTGERAAIETDPSGDDFLARVCVGWEREAMRAHEFGVRVVCLRIGLVLSPDGGALEQMMPMFKMGLGGAIGSGQQWWSWIHLTDLVELIVHSVDRNDVRGPINAASPTPMRQVEFARVLAHVLHRPSVVPAPAFAIKMILGEFAVELLASRRLDPTRAQESGFAFRFPTLEPALRDLFG